MRPELPRVVPIIICQHWNKCKRGVVTVVTVEAVYAASVFGFDTVGRS